MRRQKSYFYGRLICAVCVIVALGAGIEGCKSRPKEEKTESVRDSLPNEGDAVIPFKIKTFDGKVLDLDSLKGRPIVINFFASWCGPCRAEAGGFSRQYLAFKNSGVEFVGVAIQDSENAAKQFMKEFKWSFPAGLDETGEITREYKLYGIPKTFIVGKDGRFRFIYTGDLSEEDLANEIKKAL